MKWSKTITHSNPHKMEHFQKVPCRVSSNPQKPKLGHRGNPSGTFRQGFYVNFFPFLKCFRKVFATFRTILFIKKMYYLNISGTAESTLIYFSPWICLPLLMRRNTIADSSTSIDFNEFGVTNYYTIILQWTSIFIDRNVTGHFKMEYEWMQIEFSRLYWTFVLIDRNEPFWNEVWIDLNWLELT